MAMKKFNLSPGTKNGVLGNKISTLNIFAKMPRQAREEFSGKF
jgi:hypothetical protein